MSTGPTSTGTTTTSTGTGAPTPMTPSAAVEGVVAAIDRVPELDVRPRAGLGRLVERVAANAGAVRTALDSVRALALAVMDAIVASQTDRSGIRTELTTLQLQVGIIGSGLADERTARANGDTAASNATAAVAAQLAGEAAVRAAADAALADRMAKAEQAITEEKAARAAGDTAELTRAQAAEAALATRVSALETRVATLASGRGLANGGASVVLLAGQTITVPVVFDAPAPTASYLAMPVLDAAGGLFTSIKVDSVLNRTTTGCSVVVRSTAAVSVTGQIAVTVLALKV